MRPVKKSTLLIIAAFIFVIAVVVVITACKSPVGADLDKNGGQLPDTAGGDTRLLVGMYDGVEQSVARAAGNGKNIQGIEALNLIVRQMVIIDSNDRHITILDEDREMDILSVSRSDPVILSNVSVEPGSYKELRLVLKNENTITVNGETHSIKIPSGEQSGLKLKGPFTIPKGKLFTLMIALDTDRSVHWNQGQGYMLKPVVNIANGTDVLGIFRGNFKIANSLGYRETILQLYSDNTARLRIADYPNYTLHANYEYNSVTKNLRLNNTSLDAPGLRKRELKQVMKEMPNEILLPVKQWSLDSIIAIDTGGLTCNLYRVDEFNFSEGVSFTGFTLNIDYPNGSKVGKDVLTEIRFIDTGMPPLTYISTFEGSRITLDISAPNNSIQGSSTRIQVTSYLFDNPDNLNIEAGFFASLPALYMSNSNFSETTENPWRKADVFTLIRDTDYQEFTVAFPPSLNIKMHHDNFTNNKPVITWDAYPGANGYFVMVLVKEKDENALANGDYFAAAYHGYTKETQIQMQSNRVTFTNTSTSLHEIPPSIVKGDFIVVEVYALDNSGSLNTQAHKGAYLMDSAIINR